MRYGPRLPGNKSRRITNAEVLARIRVNLPVGICKECRRRRAEDPFVTCRECLDRHRAHYKSRRTPCPA